MNQEEMEQLRTVRALSEASQRPPATRNQRGSAFVMAIAFLAVLSVLAGAVVTAVMARAPVTYQDASWQEARLAAEAGLASTLDTMNAHPSKLTTSGTTWWPGWLTLIQSGTGTGTAVATSGTDLAISGSSSPNSITNISGVSNPIYSGTNLSTASGINAYVNLSVQAVYPTYSGSAASPWYRIRAMGTVPLAGPVRNAMDKADIELRRVSLRSVRDELHGESPIPALDPPWWSQTRASASRVIEVLVKPRLVGLFSYAIYTNQTMNWGMNGKFYTDSYNSNYTNGEYPGGAIDNSDPAAAHSYGDIGTGSDQPQAITLNGGTVNGTAETPTGASGVDQSTSVTGGILTSPAITWDVPIPPSTAGWTYSTNAPATIAVAGNTQLHVTSAGAITFSGSGNVTLVIDSNWNTKNGSIIVPPGVHATIYVGGSMDFGTGSVNDPANPLNSGRPENLEIFGCSETGASFNISTTGTPVISAAIYAPRYDFILKGGGVGVFYGSLIANSYSMNGGGNIAFHYDEDLANFGPKIPVGYSIASYFEDQRL